MLGAEGHFQTMVLRGGQTKVQDHRFEWVETMQLQAIMPPLMLETAITAMNSPRVEF